MYPNLTLTTFLLIFTKQFLHLSLTHYLHLVHPFSSFPLYYYSYLDIFFKFIFNEHSLCIYVYSCLSLLLIMIYFIFFSFNNKFTTKNINKIIPSILSFIRIKIFFFETQICVIEKIQ